LWRTHHNSQEYKCQEEEEEKEKLLKEED